VEVQTRMVFVVKSMILNLPIRLKNYAEGVTYANMNVCVLMLMINRSAGLPQYGQLGHGTDNVS
jgi:hypothetical protein